ncbi:MAG: ATP synthase F1 subunit gamma [Armatimonadetes bacterium]|nr:ATP synthase F1 subunit gamma [Armatimonadota bacterium]
MPQDLRTIRRKIRTVRNIWQITRAMKMVAAARLRRLQAKVAESRGYWEGLWQLAERLVDSGAAAEHPFVSAAEPRRPLLVVVAGDRGLCGSYNYLVFRRAERALEETHYAGVVAVGWKTTRWAERAGIELAAKFPAYAERPQDAAIVHLTVADYVARALTVGEYDGVDVVSTPFVSTLHNVPRLVCLLPFRPPERHRWGLDYIFEPSARAVVDAVLPRAIQARTAQIVIEAAAAEQAARMTAMSAASDNAEELSQELQRLHNRLRQQEITTEILEVVAGAEALTQEE